jgi:hypothetical protein
MPMAAKITKPAKISGGANINGETLAILRAPPLYIAHLGTHTAAVPQAECHDGH